MDILYAKSKWEWEDRPLETYLQQTATDGYDAAEVYLPWLGETSAGTLRRLCEDHGLKLIAQGDTRGATVEAHLQSFRDQWTLASEAGALAINLHCGSDMMPLSDSVRLYEAVLDEAASHPEIAVFFETHRQRPLFSLPNAEEMLKALPQMTLTADLSHWMTVHESELNEVDDRLNTIFERVGHIHARIGFAEGPQVNDPFASAWEALRNRYLELWRRILDAQRRAGREWIFITPEFGPFPYAPTNPASNEPHVNIWDTNRKVMAWLKEELKA